MKILVSPDLLMELATQVNEFDREFAIEMRYIAVIVNVQGICKVQRPNGMLLIYYKE